MNTSFLKLLRCPFCAGTLSASGSEPVAAEPEYGVLSCYCGRYPIVAGIPVLKKGNIGSAGQSSEEVIALIENGRRSEALFSLLTPPGLPPSPSWIRSLAFSHGSQPAQELRVGAVGTRSGKSRHPHSWQMKKRPPVTSWISISAGIRTSLCATISPSVSATGAIWWACPLLPAWRTSPIKPCWIWLADAAT